MSEIDNWRIRTYPWCATEHPEGVFKVGRYVRLDHKLNTNTVEFYEHFCGTGTRKVEWSTRHEAQQCADTLNASRTWAGFNQD